MLEMSLSNERLLSNSTPRFLTDDEESREQSSSVRHLHLDLCFFQNLVVSSGGQSTQINYLSKSTDTYNKILLQ